MRTNEKLRVQLEADMETYFKQGGKVKTSRIGLVPVLNPKMKSSRNEDMTTKEYLVRRAQACFKYSTVAHLYVKENNAFTCQAKKRKKDDGWTFLTSFYSIEEAKEYQI